MEVGLFSPRESSNKIGPIIWAIFKFSFDVS